MLTRLFAAQGQHIVPAWIAAVQTGHAPGDTPAACARPPGGPDPAERMLHELAPLLYAAIAGDDADHNTPHAALPRALHLFADMQALRPTAPEQAAACILLFKPLLRAHVLPCLPAAHEAFTAYLEAESRADSLTVLFCGAYCRARARLYAIRATAARVSAW